MATNKPMTEQKTEKKIKLKKKAGRLLLTFSCDCYELVYAGNSHRSPSPGPDTADRRNRDFQVSNHFP